MHSLNVNIYNILGNTKSTLFTWDYKKTFNKEIDKIMADAKLQAQKVRDEAKVQSDKLRAEGVKLTNQAKVKADEIANQAKVKADEEAAKLAGKGSNPFEKIANAKVAEIAKKTAYIEIEKKKKAIGRQRGGCKRVKQL